MNKFSKVITPLVEDGSDYELMYKRLPS